MSKSPMQVSQPEVARLYAEHAGRVHRWVRRFEPAGDATEVVHEVFVKVLERLADFRADASPTTWLYRVTTNHCLNRLRDRGRRAQLWQQHAAALWQADSAAADQETVASLTELWGNLDDELAETGIYYFIDGMTHAEIARIVGCSERTVGNRIERIRKAAEAATKGAP
ncbi:MAG: RNA polymerase sigma factor [Nannocystaceae bacterium]|nr:RNA polymerase sigma factor [Nannocystaceae bacterium]